MGTRWAPFPGRGLWKQQQGWCPQLQEPTPCIPPVILCPQRSLPPPTPTSWPSQVTPQHELDFTNPCGEGRHWVAKLLPSHGFRRAGQARGLARNAVTPARLVRAGCLQQQQELGRPQPMVRRAVGVPEPHTAGQAAGKHVAQDLSGLSGLSRRLRAGWRGSCEFQAQGAPAAQRQQGLNAVAP